ncbi:MAG: hypothetical protein ACYC67_08905 [Prosthecobacter sp.]
MITLKKWEWSVILSCPPPGSGVHDWTFKLLRMLVRHYPQDLDLFTAARCICDHHASRPVTDRELADQIPNARCGSCHSKKRTRTTVPIGQSNAWPSVDVQSIDKIVRGGATLETLRQLSPENLSANPLSSEDAINLLFPGDPLLCCAHSCKSASTRRKSAWRNIGKFQFLVPSPMAKTSGLNQQGKRSERCLDNTGRRRFLVVEFDFKPDVTECEASVAQSIANLGRASAQQLNNLEKSRLVAGFNADGVTVLDMCAALIVSLSKLVKPALVVHSGGKSLHVWFYCEGVVENHLRLFMDHAVSLGADKATWNRCQLVRMPGGLRNNGDGKTVLQQIHYFDPGAMSI